MWAKLQSGKVKESDPEVAEYDDATESRLVLYAIKDALIRTNYACRVVIYTECDYVAAAINQHWPEEWQKNNWKNSKGKDVKDAVLIKKHLASMTVEMDEDVMDVNADLTIDIKDAVKLMKKLAGMTVELGKA